MGKGANNEIVFKFRIVSGIDSGIEFIDVLSPPKNTTKTIRYPGDIDVTDDMCPETARQNILLCQAKIKGQAKEIYRLKQITERQRVKIETMKGLLKKNSIKSTPKSYTR